MLLRRWIGCSITTTEGESLETAALYGGYWGVSQQPGRLCSVVIYPNDEGGQIGLYAAVPLLLFGRESFYPL
ncbi:hypothetical protein AcW1_009365 [Taiwanofungus camphoratus]|nr:hypothetical protein AcW1_009365 [Antrodia cinnamomea]